MESRAAREAERERRNRIERMTPGERVELAMRLGEEGLAEYMAIHQVNRATAVARIKAARRLGRRQSTSAEAETNDD